MAIDPVCKMQVDVSNPPGGKSEYQGKTYYFCSPGCRTSFQKEPEKFLKSTTPQPM
ncbi:MAG: YHS domain-containing protein [Chloroflexi bacterium]|nr:YHS domain-containing protein [Chloroflexota bacterium]